MKNEMVKIRLEDLEDILFKLKNAENDLYYCEYEYGLIGKYPHLDSSSRYVLDLIEMVEDIIENHNKKQSMNDIKITQYNMEDEYNRIMSN